MSLLTTKCIGCKKIFGYDPHFKCSLCKSYITPNLCIQCHNKQNHRFIPLSYRYGIKQYAMQLVFAILISYNLYGILKVVNL